MVHAVSLLAGEFQHDLPLPVGYRLGREPTNAHKRHILEPFVGFDLFETNGFVYPTDRRDVNGGPTIVVGGGVLVGFLDYFGDADDIGAFITMIKEHFVSLFHRPQMKTRGIIADAAPYGRLVFYQLVQAVD